MSKSTKIIIGIIIAIIIGGIWYGATREPKEEGVIKIGFISALSGNAGIWGESLKKGFEFGLEEINKEGGINGKKLEIVYEDDACDPTTGVSAFNKVINIDGAKIIIGTVCSSVAMAVAPITQENRILYMASGATHPDVPKQGDLIFRAWLSDAYEAKELAKYAFKQLRLEKIAITYFNDNPAGIALKDNFKETFESNGGKITKIEPYTSTERDFRTGLTKVINDNPDGIYMAAIPEQTPLIVNRTREMGYEGIILLYGPSVLSEGIPEKINDKSNIYYPSPTTKKEADFWENYELQKGQEADLLIALGYDSLKLIVYGLDRCGEDNDCIRDELLKLKDFQITRGTIGYDADGDLIGIEFEIKKLE